MKIPKTKHEDVFSDHVRGRVRGILEAGCSNSWLMIGGSSESEWAIYEHEFSVGEYVEDNLFDASDWNNTVASLLIQEKVSPDNIAIIVCANLSRYQDDPVGGDYVASIHMTWIRHELQLVPLQQDEPSAWVKFAEAVFVDPATEGAFEYMAQVARQYLLRRG